jgi:hypothetical protein
VGGQSSFSQVAAAMAASPSRTCVPFFFLSFLYYFCSPKTIQHVSTIPWLCSPEQVPISALACYSATEQPGDGVRAAECKCERRADSCGGVWLQVAGLDTTEASSGVQLRAVCRCSRVLMPVWACRSVCRRDKCELLWWQWRASSGSSVQV